MRTIGPHEAAAIDRLRKKCTEDAWTRAVGIFWFGMVAMLPFTQVTGSRGLWCTLFGGIVGAAIATGITMSRNCRQCCPDCLSEKSKRHD